MDDQIPEWVYSFNLCKILIINQTDNEKIKIESDKLTIINSKTRGLSKSRNLAAEKCPSKYMLICDNDNKYYEAELKRFFEHVRLDQNEVYLYSSNQKTFSFKMGQKIGLREICGTASWQICVTAENVRKYRFDENFGLGTKHVKRGEENILLADLQRTGKKIKSYSGVVVYHPDLGSGYAQNTRFLQDQYKIYKRMFGMAQAVALIIRKFLLRSVRKWLKYI